MPLSDKNVRTFHRTLYAGQLQSVTLHKRHDDMAQGTITVFKLFQCRWSRIFKMGETLAGDMLTAHRRQLHIPRIEMDRVGVHYINPTDKFIDKQGREWQPESPQQIVIQLFEQHVCCDCLMVKGLELHG